LNRIIEISPNPAVSSVVCWRLIDLTHWIFAELRISVSKQALSRILREICYRKLPARPPHAWDPAELAAFTPDSPDGSRRYPPKAWKSW
jgi:hypothetical protein